MQNNNNYYQLIDLKQLQELDSLIGLSACGPTAIKNILKALKFEDLSILKDNNKLLELVPARVRDYETKNILIYLKSRAMAGTIHTDLIEGIEKIVGDQVKSIFIRIDSREDPKKLGEWLYDFMKNEECVPLATENLFYQGNDALHHQMIYAIDNDYIYTSNPIQKIPLKQFFTTVSSEPFMIIPQKHIEERNLKDKQEQEELQSQEPWCQYEVFSQILQIKQLQFKNNQKVNIKEQASKDKLFYEGQKKFVGLTIPWGGLVGITLFYRKEKEKQIHQKIKKQNNLRQKTIKLPLYDKLINIYDLNLN